ncbi:hypothetical protein ECC02_008089 [Trypanosoma cruzi]|uniref:Uncharacterized protein n=1 Tax=Trypanosoma cruzi TaxID=5693 RepID=A0A7J6XWU0_TRYCR|nr:hypothetical protein ECC02_008089 [Trypanosoma cruzi]
MGGRDTGRRTAYTHTHTHTQRERETAGELDRDTAEQPRHAAGTPAHTHTHSQRQKRTNAHKPKKVKTKNKIAPTLPPASGGAAVGDVHQRTAVAENARAGGTGPARNGSQNKRWSHPEEPGAKQTAEDTPSTHNQRHWHIYIHTAAGCSNIRGAPLGGSRRGRRTRQSVLPRVWAVAAHNGTPDRRRTRPAPSSARSTGGRHSGTDQQQQRHLNPQRAAEAAPVARSRCLGGGCVLGGCIGGGCALGGCIGGGCALGGCIGGSRCRRSSSSSCCSGRCSSIRAVPSLNISSIILPLLLSRGAHARTAEGKEKHAEDAAQHHCHLGLCGIRLLLAV